MLSIKKNFYQMVLSYFKITKKGGKMIKEINNVTNSRFWIYTQNNDYLIGAPR